MGAPAVRPPGGPCGSASARRWWTRPTRQRPARSRSGTRSCQASCSGCAPPARSPTRSSTGPGGPAGAARSPWATTGSRRRLIPPRASRGPGRPRSPGWRPAASWASWPPASTPPRSGPPAAVPSRSASWPCATSRSGPGRGRRRPASGPTVDCWACCPRRSGRTASPGRPPGRRVPSSGRWATSASIASPRPTWLACMRPGGTRRPGRTGRWPCCHTCWPWPSAGASGPARTRADTWSATGRRSGSATCPRPSWPASGPQSRPRKRTPTRWPRSGS